MHLRLLAVAVALTVPVLSWAQTRDAVHRDPPPHFSITPLYGHPNPHPQIGLPLPRIGLPLSSLGLRPPDSKIDRRHDGSRHHRGRSYAPWPVMYVMVPQLPAYIEQPPAAAPASVEQPVSKGSLVLHVEPANTQVFVDGYYVGAVEEFSGARGGAFLDSGPHKIELITPGHEPVSFDVMIAANQAIAYRHEMKLNHTTAPPAQMPKVPATFYLIPGCYMGNVPPKDAGLPATCDVARVQTFRN